MSYHLHGKHLVAGARVETARKFWSAPAVGDAQAFSAGTAALVDDACTFASEAFSVLAATTREQRAKLLEDIAARIEVYGPEITDIGSRETGLPTARLEGERQRTTSQLRLFAEHIRNGTYLDFRSDAAQPDRKPAPRPSLVTIQRPIGPVAVFGASNFPLAFSVAGGDTAAALAAGCPVVVKGHSAHPGLSEIVGEAILAAVAAAGLPGGTFSLIQGGDRQVGERLVQHPAVKAVGFTGSTVGGRALFNLCAARPEPIPFFGELGSVNPMFLLPGALGDRGEEIGTGWAASLTMGAGQFCTNPGIAIVLDSADAQTFKAAALTALTKVAPQTMLTEGIAAAYAHGQDRFEQHPALRPILTGENGPRNASPSLLEATGADFIADHNLQDEVFGPLGIIVTCASETEMRTVAEAFQGQLTATLHLSDADIDFARELVPILERMAGRVLVNGFPTGVEVADAMVHGGPYPASTNFGATSVGTLSIRRFLRPVCYQNFPPELLPERIAQ